MLSESETSVTHLAIRSKVYSTIPELLTLFLFLIVILSVSEGLVAPLADPLKDLLSRADVEFFFVILSTSEGSVAYQADRPLIYSTIPELLIVIGHT